MSLFRDRFDAGFHLATDLMAYAGTPDVIVLALPRGGVPVAYEIARALSVPLDVYIVRKLGVPGHEELAMGAVASDGSCVVDQQTVHAAGVTDRDFETELRRQFAELKRREAAYRDGLPEPELSAKVVIIVDDGLATGASMYSAITALRQRNPTAIVVAIPVAPEDTCRALEAVADHVVCLYRERYFRAVGLYYENFEQVSDEEVRHLLRQFQVEGKMQKAGAQS
jgi:putative phosphoribosyl transferase